MNKTGNDSLTGRKRQHGRDVPAVVVGLCSHGLATVRALAKRGVAVHAVEQNPDLPGVQTRYAAVHLVPDINGEALIDSLIGLHPEITNGGGRNPVLFLMNDNMVLVIARHWPRLENLYQLSWHACRKQVERLLYKSALEDHCREHGLRYPRSWTIESRISVADIYGALAFPLVVKPVKPLGKFKARIIKDIASLEALLDEQDSGFPLLAQQWIPGDDSSLFFCALYLDNGKEIAHFSGRKMLSHPPAHGQTTAAEPCPDEALHEFTGRFFTGLSLSGPVSLEVKKDETGEFWVIEPTLGRTDFWLGLCVANGVNIPFIEYCNVLGIPLELDHRTGNTRWYDTERDPGSYLRLSLARGRPRLPGRAVFSYLDISDPKPFLRAAFILAQRKFRSITGRITVGAVGTR